MVPGGPEGLEVLGAEVESWFPALSPTLNHCEIHLCAVNAVAQNHQRHHEAQKHHRKEA